MERNDAERAARYFEEAVGVAREGGDEREELAALGYLSVAHIRSGDLERGADILEQVVAAAARIGADDRQAWALSNLGTARGRLGQHDEARLALARALRLLDRLGWTEGIVYTLAGLATVASALDDPVRAARLLSAAERLGESIDLRWQIDETEQKDATKRRVREALGAEYETAFSTAALVPIERVIAAEIEAGAPSS